MKKYLLLDEKNLIKNARFSRTSIDGWIEVEDLEPIDEKIYSTYYENNEYRFDEELYEQYLKDKEESVSPEPLPTPPAQLDRIEESIQEIKNMREQEIVDRYTLTLINEGIIS